MKSRLMISAAAIALLAGAGLANAQGGMKNESGGGATMQQNAPSGGAGATTGRESSAPSQTQSPSEKSPSATKGQRAEENAPGAKSKGMSSENETKGNMKAEGREGQKGNMKAEGKEGRDAGKSAEGKEGRETGKSAEGKEGRETGKSAQGREGQTTTNKNAETEGGRSQMTTGQAGAGAKLSTEQRTKITTVIRNEHVESVNNVDFNISVGTRVPRDHVHLRPLPSEVITIYPEWRGYQFILVRNEILVIDPATYEIVAVLPA
jgi:hypothetical protein